MHMPTPLSEGSLIERLFEIGASPPRPISDLIFEPIFLVKLFSWLSSSSVEATVCRPIRWEKAGNFATPR